MKTSILLFIMAIAIFVTTIITNARYDTVQKCQELLDNANPQA